MNTATTLDTATPEVPAYRLPAPARVLAFVAGFYGLALVVYLALRLALADSLWWLAFLHTFTPYYFAPLPVLIPLLLVAGARRMAVRLLPLALIGLLLYGPLWLPRSIAADTRGQSIKVVTFNIMVLTHQFDRMADWLRATDADVILLQEVGGLEPEAIISALEDAYPYSINMEGTTQLAVSRYPVTDMALVDLGSWFADRFVLDVNGAALAVYNVHMDMPRLREPRLPIIIPNELLQLAMQYDETYRNSLIYALLDRLAGENLPHIVAGDFNTSDNALIYHEIAATMRDSFRETSTGLGATWPASAGDNDSLMDIIPPLVRIDYIWHSDHLRALSTQLGPDLGSDHLPLVAVLALP